MKVVVSGISEESMAKLIRKYGLPVLYEQKAQTITTFNNPVRGQESAFLKLLEEKGVDFQVIEA